LTLDGTGMTTIDEALMPTPDPAAGADPRQGLIRGRG
jgi:hypothetical protein